MGNFLPIDPSYEGWGRNQYQREYDDIRRDIANNLALERDKYRLQELLGKDGLQLDRDRLKEESRRFDLSDATNRYGIDKQLEGLKYSTDASKYSAELSANTRKYEADAAVAQSLFGNTLGFASAIGSRGSNARMANYWG